MSIKGRIRGLEEEGRNSPEPPCEKCGGRIIYEELSAYDAALSRSVSRGNSPRRIGPSWKRVQRLYKEVVNEELTSAS